jgi:hypothetical protein
MSKSKVRSMLIYLSFTSGEISYENSASKTISQAEWNPFQTHYFSKNLASPENKTGTSGSVARNSDH